MKTRRSPRAQEQLWRQLNQPTQKTNDLSTAKSHIEALILCLKGHIYEEAGRQRITVKALCPCLTNEIAKAEKFLQGER